MLFTSFLVFFPAAAFESTLHEMQCSDGQYISVLRKWNGEQYVCLPEMWRKYFPEVYIYIHTYLYDTRIRSVCNNVEQLMCEGKGERWKLYAWCHLYIHTVLLYVVHLCGASNPNNLGHLYERLVSSVTCVAVVELQVNRNHLSSALRRLELETLMPTAQQATLLRSAQVISIRYVTTFHSW